VFFRIKEKMRNKVLHDEYKEYYAVNELEHLKILSNKIKIKFNRENFYIIYFTPDEQMYYEEDNIISINLTDHEYSSLMWQTCCPIITNVFKRNNDFIDNCINKV